MLDLRLYKVRVGEVLLSVLPADAFIPDTNACFIAQVEKARILGVMTAANKITAHVQKLLNIAHEQPLRHRMSELGMCFMAVKTQQTHWMVIDKDLLISNGDLTNTDPCNQIIFTERP